MRQPTRIRKLYEWYAAALAGRNPPVVEDEPQCGWYRMRSVKGGPWQLVRIWCEQVTGDGGELIEPERIVCELNGEPVRSYRVWPSCASKPISNTEYAAMRARENSTPLADAMRATHVAVDLSKLPAMRPGTK